MTIDETYSKQNLRKGGSLGEVKKKLSTAS
jgi:hypothetical protein